MAQSSFRILIRRVERPYQTDADAYFNWICRSLGFFEPIDKEKTASSIFREIFKAAEEGKPLSSTAIARRIRMSRGACINHLNRLQSAGLIARQGKYYLPRSASVHRTIQEIEEDVERIFRHMEEVARRIDKAYGFPVEEDEE